MAEYRFMKYGDFTKKYIRDTSGEKAAISMINSINTIQNIYRIHKTETNVNKVAKPGDLKGKEISGDALALSDESRIKQKALQALKMADDMRSEKVDLLSQQIATGTYQVSDDEVAEKMVADSVLDIVL